MDICGDMGVMLLQLLESRAQNRSLCSSMTTHTCFLFLKNKILVYLVVIIWLSDISNYYKNEVQFNTHSTNIGPIPVLEILYSSITCTDSETKGVNFCCWLVVFALQTCLESCLLGTIIVKGWCLYLADKAVHRLRRSHFHSFLDIRSII